MKVGNRMRRLLVVTLVVLAMMVTVASAQTKKPVSTQDSDWKGFYVGGYAGGTFATANARTSTVFSPTGYFATSSIPAIAAAGVQKLQPRGFSGGIEGGVNFQRGHLVYGGELDYGVLRASQMQSATVVYPCCAPTTFTLTQSINTTWMFSGRARVGYATGRALFYATAGPAVIRFNYQETFTDTFASARENGGINTSRTGYAVGGGAEFKVDRRFSFRGEYLYAALGRYTKTSTNLTAVFGGTTYQYPTNVFTHSTDFNANIVRAGAYYHF